MCSEELLHGFYHITGILYSCRFICGMHGKLGQADIYGVQGNLCRRNIAKGASACLVGAIGKKLYRYIRLLANIPE